MSKAEISKGQEKLVRLKDTKRNIKRALKAIEKAEEALALIEDS